MLDINLFRADKGGNPDIIRESQRSRFAPVELVDEVIALDKAWRERQFELDKIRQELNATSKKIGKLKAVRIPLDLRCSFWPSRFRRARVSCDGGLLRCRASKKRKQRS
jgi:hypothetical protein